MQGDWDTSGGDYIAKAKAELEKKNYEARAYKIAWCLLHLPEPPDSLKNISTLEGIIGVDIQEGEYTKKTLDSCRNVVIKLKAFKISRNDKIDIKHMFTKYRKDSKLIK